MKVDLITNRNKKMIDILSSKKTNGMFLFFIEQALFEVEQGFILPPGLSEEQMTAFKRDFLALFERYAKLANKKP